MEEAIENAREELKRVDHLVYVSLKYTRTVDVIRNTLLRMVDAIDFAFDCLLRFSKEKKKIKDVPSIPGLKVDSLEKLFKGDALLSEYVQFYALLRKVLKAKYTKREEYRRHVTMTVKVEGESIEVNIDVLKEHYEKVKEIVAYAEGVIKND